MVAVQVARGRLPVALEGELAPRPSHWLWLVKWLLAIPYVRADTSRIST